MITRTAIEVPRDKNAASIVTHNRNGRTTTFLNEVSRAFVEHALEHGGPVLDIGCAFGVASRPLVERSITTYACDIDPAHLNELHRSVPGPLQQFLFTSSKHFPRELRFAPDFFSAVHAANLFNFLTGPEIAEGLSAIATWLQPGGSLFVISGSPYARNVRGFIPEYRRRKESGMPWPGYVQRLRDYSDDPTLNELPESLHLLDDDVMRAACVAAGLEVVEAELFSRAGVPDYIELDGRENLRLIARKPRTERTAWTAA